MSRGILESEESFFEMNRLEIFACLFLSGYLTIQRVKFPCDIVNGPFKIVRIGIIILK